jgi:hypothetical protein
MKWILSLSLILLCALLSAQIIQSTQRIALSAQVEESSGLVEVSGRLVTHNDSGDGPFLYEIDSLSGSVLRKVFIANASANDWEDISADNQFIYIGDFGNNTGTRTNLAIYKINRTDFLFNDTVSADAIYFNYAEQNTFGSNQFTPFDAEAMVCVGDSIYLFTKDRSTFSSSAVYTLPKTAGNYSISRKAILSTPGLVTAGCFNGSANKIVLCGYSFNSVFIHEILFTNGWNLPSSLQMSYTLAVTGPQQVEAIERISATTYYISSEKDNGLPAQLSEFILNSNLSIPIRYKAEAKLYPNPCADYLQISNQVIGKISILNLQGQLIVERDYHNSIDVSELPSGFYFLSWKESNGQSYVERFSVQH